MGESGLVIRWRSAVGAYASPMGPPGSNAIAHTVGSSASVDSDIRCSRPTCAIANAPALREQHWFVTQLHVASEHRLPRDFLNIDSPLQPSQERPQSQSLNQCVTRQNTVSIRHPAKNSSTEKLCMGVFLHCNPCDDMLKNTAGGVLDMKRSQTYDARSPKTVSGIRGRACKIKGGWRSLFTWLLEGSGAAEGASEVSLSCPRLWA